MQGMTVLRFNFLMDHPEEELTQSEVDDGWHFCPEFDGLLMRNNDHDWGDLDTCVCGRPA